MVYDAEDRKLLFVEAEGTPEERTSGVIEYDRLGNALQVRDGNGNISITEFNALNLPNKQFNPAPFNGQFVETSYNKNGQPISMTNRRGHTTTTSYDALGRVVTITDPVPFSNQTIVTTDDAPEKTDVAQMIEALSFTVTLTAGKNQSQVFR